MFWRWDGLEKSRTNETTQNNLTTHRTLKHKPSNSLVKVQLVKLPQKIIPCSAGVYLTDQTNTSLEPHPRDMSGYLFASFDQRDRQHSYRNRALSELDFPDLKLYRGSLFQKKPNVNTERCMSQSEDKIAYSRGSSIDKDSHNSKRHLRVSFDRQYDDSKSSAIHKLSNFNPSNPSHSGIANDSMRNHANSKHTHQSRILSFIDGKTNDTNFGGNSSKIDSGASRSILKKPTIHNQHISRSSSLRRVRFAKVRTVVYFKDMHHTQAGNRQLNSSVHHS